MSLNGGPMRMGLGHAVAAAQSIFAGNKQGGIWLADTAAMYVASGGAALAGVGIGTGMLMDASKGMALGSDLAATVNTASSWIKYGNNEITQESDGSIKIAYVDNASGGYCYIVPPRLSSSLVLGKRYKITLDARAVGSVTFTLNSGVIQARTVNSTSYTAISFEFNCTSETGTFFVVSTMESGEEIAFRNISVKEVEGNHAIQASAANRPTHLQAEQTGRHYLSADATDSLVATMPALGTNCTVITRLPTELVVATGQTVSGATTIVPASANFCGKAIFNGALTADQLFTIQQLFGWYGTAGTNGSPL